LIIESHDVLEGGLRSRIVDEKDTMGPRQVPEEASVNNERDGSKMLLPITIPKIFTWPRDDIQDKDTIVRQSHGFLVGTWQ